MLTPLLIGFALGFLGAIPIAGPVSALVLKQALQRQYRKGRWLGFGAGLAEALYVLLAFLGFSLILQKVPGLETIARALSALILLALGLHFILMRPPQASSPEEVRKGGSARRAFWIGFGVSLVNPTLLASWTTVITSLYPLRLFSFARPAALTFALGVWMGTGAWFALMVTLIRKNQKRFQRAWLGLILRAMGALLLILSVLAIRSLIQG